MPLLSQSALPPTPARRPTRLVAPGDVRIDDYYWLRDRTNPEVIAYLQAENDYAASCEDGNKYHVFMNEAGRVVVEKSK